MSGDMLTAILSQSDKPIDTDWKEQREQEEFNYFQKIASRCPCAEMSVTGTIICTATRKRCPTCAVELPACPQYYWMSMVVI